jgi:hypothetical protein
MSRLTPADFDNVIDLIEAVYATPKITGYGRSSGVYSYAFSVANIILSYRANFPSGTMTDAQIANLLLRGSRSGVFGVICSNATSSSVSECDSSVTIAEALYNVNQSMVRVNPSNKIYAAVFNGPTTSGNSVDVFNYPIDSQLTGVSNLIVGGGGSPVGYSC